ncbi:MAG TPA: tetratricopeptide repeat protein [Methylomirabilota bacterium]|nr:tetratricopeptide repeat protein [Methylomirabilota bacterium]
MNRFCTAAASLLCLTLGLHPAAGAGQTQAPPARSTPGPKPKPEHSDPLAPLLQQAQDAIDKGNYADAIAPLQKYIAERPDYAYAHFQLGYAYSELNRWDDAEAEYERTITLDPHMAEAYLNLGIILMKSNPAAAADSLRQAAALQPTDSRPRFLYGLALEHAGKVEAAVIQYQAALALSPKDFDIHLALAQALLRLKRAPEAETEFRAAVAIKPDDASAARGLAQALEAQQKFPAAAEQLDAYLKLRPDDGAERIARAYDLMQINQFDAALAELDRAEAAAPPTPDSRKMRAGIYMQQGRWKDASVVFEASIPLSPNDAELYAWLGRCQLELHDYKDSVDNLNKAMQLNPADAGPLRDLVDAYYLGKDCPSTLRTIDLLSQHEPLKPVAWFVRGSCYDTLDQKADAVAAYQKFLDLDQGRHDTQDFQAKQRILALQRQLQKHH